MDTELTIGLGTLHHNLNPQQNNSSSNLQNERQVVRRAGRLAIRQFLEQHNCFSVLRISGKVVVFDTRIPVQLAFYALVEHDMLCAPLWDFTINQFVGLFTVTDFIDILRHYSSTNKDVSALATNSITDIVLSQQQQQQQSSGILGRLAGAAKTAAQNDFKVRPFRGADSSCTLHQACRQLLNTGDDFLPIVYCDDMRVLACLSYTNILEHLVTHFREQRRLFDDSIADLGIGTWAPGILPDGNNATSSSKSLITVHQNQTLAEALELMHRHNLSALPVLDDNQRVYGVYSRSDITFLTKATDAEDAVRNLDLKLVDVVTKSPAAASGGATTSPTTAGGQPQPPPSAAGAAGGGAQQPAGSAPGNAASAAAAAATQPQQQQDITTTPDALRTCSPAHTLQAIFESFSQLRFNRLYVIDDEHHLLGVVSAKDLVAYFLMDDDYDPTITAVVEVSTAQQ